MGSLLYSINPGDSLEQLVEAAGPGITTKFIELQIDTGNDITDGSAPVSPRPIKRGEVVLALNKIFQAVMADPNLPD